MGAPTASIRQGRVTSVGTASVSSSHHQGPSLSEEGCSAQIPARRLLAPPGACRSRVAAKIPRQESKCKHLALKNKTKQNYLTDEDYTRGGLSNFKTRASWQHAKKRFGSFTTVVFFFFFCSFLGKHVWSVMLVNLKFTTFKRVGTILCLWGN